MPKSAVYVVLFVALAGGYLFFLLERQEEPSRPRPASEERAAGTATAPLSEKERGPYLEDSVVIEAIEIVDEVKVGSRERVPGLKRVKGTVKNRGERVLYRLFVVVALRDDQGRVLGSYTENVLRDRKLGSQERLQFSYLIPERKAFRGVFDHTLK